MPTPAPRSLASDIALSIVAPAHNEAENLRPLVAEIHAAISPLAIAHEIVIIDDGSTDSTAELARSFHDPRLRLIHQENSGVAQSRNRGLAISTTPTVCFLDADDTIDPAFLATMLPMLAGHDLVPAAYR
ncbi:MAG TPA: glycosyltransferase family 2 protein, partial [Phycisphaerales bacterium]|nr:glycosyltransferase family 2 protein [Phycisphaerales bacterium]